jgi:hypothetical protein
MWLQGLLAGYLADVVIATSHDCLFDVHASVCLVQCGESAAATSLWHPPPRSSCSLVAQPDNLLLDGGHSDGGVDGSGGPTVKVADFGLSKHKIQSFVTCHDLRGTLPYMAPELVRSPSQVRFVAWHGHGRNVPADRGWLCVLCC